jgi:hypothetical protein
METPKYHSGDENMVLKVGDIRMFDLFNDGRNIFPIVVTKIVEKPCYYHYVGAGVAQMYPVIDKLLPGIYPMYSETLVIDGSNIDYALWLFNEKDTHPIKTIRQAAKQML